MKNVQSRANTVDLIASFGRPMPFCPTCNSRMMMSCREAWDFEPLVFTFECRTCSFVVQRAKARDERQDNVQARSSRAQ